MCKSGDLGRWHADGTPEYVGRNDDQVKIRGYRIELAEIEVQLCRAESVREAVVVARDEGSGNKRLVAYVVAAGALDVEGLRAQLKAALPEYMVPSAFVKLEQLPLAPNGKLDRGACRSRSWERIEPAVRGAAGRSGAGSGGDLAAVAAGRAGGAS